MSAGLVSPIAFQDSAHATKKHRNASATKERALMRMGNASRRHALMKMRKLNTAAEEMKIVTMPTSSNVLTACARRATKMEKTVWQEMQQTSFLESNFEHERQFNEQIRFLYR